MASDMEREGQTRVVNLEKQIKAITERLVTAETTAETDPLTGLANRRKLEREVQNAILSGKSFSLLLFDMDGFKQVNDTYGHNSGDQLLKAVSSGLKDSVRGGDIACRWGGDEFAVLLPNCRLEDAGKLADRIRISSFGEFMLECSGKQVKVNVGASRGIAEYQAGESAEQLLERADKMLYDQKKERHEKRRAAAAVSA
jgi:diguanylate cyclase